jgi:hypothetical protein
MEISVLRKEFTEESTIGEMSINGQYFCFTLEDKVRPDGEPKVPGKTAIPYGKYQVVINWSNRFQKYMPLLINVPHFEGIRIHPGNTDEDTEGCILVGFYRSKDRVTESRKAFVALMKVLQSAEKKEKIYLTIYG